MGSIGTPPCSAQPARADCIPSDGGSHTIGEVQFASDGTLLVGVGDGADGGPNDPLPLRAQHLDAISGKILRINKDGTAPTDNPFYDGTNSIRSKVWLYGVRNPFRFAVDQATATSVVRRRRLEHLGGDRPRGQGRQLRLAVLRGQRGQRHVPIRPRVPRAAAGLTSRFPYVTWDHSVGTAAIGGPFYTRHALPAAVPRQLLLRRLHRQLHQAHRVRRRAQPGERDVVCHQRRIVRSPSRSAPTG